jgi:hypothetical protein
MGRPRLNADGQKELDKTENQINQFEKQVQSISLDETKAAQKHEYEPQTKLAQSEMDKIDVKYIKPRRSYPPAPNPKTGKLEEKFNEKFRSEYELKSKRVDFIAENLEVIGEAPAFWVKPFPGMSCEEWVVPVNIPINAPLYVKERLEACGYTIFKGSQSLKSEDGINYNGYMEVQERKNRLDARDISKKRNIYMGNRFAA